MKKVILSLLLFFFTFYLFAAKIDLAISSSDITISPSQPTSADSIAVTVKVHSLGTKASKASIVKLKITKGSTKVFSQKNSIPAIAVGESYDTNFNVGALQEGTYTLLIKVDPANAIPETNEGNNKVTLNLVVGGGGTQGGLGKVSLNIVASTLDFSSSVLDNLGDVGERREKESFKNNIYNLFKLAKNPEETISCTKSGTKTLNFELDTFFRPVKVEFFYDNCEDWLEGGSNSYAKLDGYMTIEITYLSDSPYSPDFEKIKQMVVKTGDGDPASDTKADYLMTFDNLHYDISISGNENDMTVSSTISGTSTCIYDNNPSKKISVNYNNVNITIHSTTYKEMTINGQMSVQSPCFTGTISVETIEPIRQYEEGDCPDSGKIKITSNSESATITFNSDGSISIDKNSDGSIDYTVQNCNQILEYPC